MQLESVHAAPVRYRAAVSIGSAVCKRRGRVHGQVGRFLEGLAPKVARIGVELQLSVSPAPDTQPLGYDHEYGELVTSEAP